MGWSIVTGEPTLSEIVVNACAVFGLAAVVVGIAAVLARVAVQTFWIDL